MSQVTAAEPVQTQFTVDADQVRRAKLPHEFFLINLIFNHIFLFVASLTVFPSFPKVIVVVPTVSLSIIAFIMLRARSVSRRESWYVNCHWQLAAKRNRTFLFLLIATLTISGGGWLVSGLLHWSRIPTFAVIGGFGLLPFMVTLLVLVVMGNDAVHLAKNGRLPAWVVRRFPPPAEFLGAAR
jgi:hypothetical protein